MHGSGDDNVHLQGTERLVNRLIELGKPFDFMDYPNRTHALSEGPGTLVHRYDLMMRFFETYIPPGPVSA
jgi:dipeptidyl-peptidase-4